MDQFAGIFQISCCVIRRPSSKSDQLHGFGRLQQTCSIPDSVTTFIEKPMHHRRDLLTSVYIREGWLIQDVPEGSNLELGNKVVSIASIY